MQITRQTIQLFALGVVMAASRQRALALQSTQLLFDSGVIYGAPVWLI